MANELFGFKENYGQVESFDVSKNEEFGDLLNYYKKREKGYEGVGVSYSSSRPRVVTLDLRRRGAE